MKYVAFLDILGFKNTLKTLGQERSIEYIENYSRIVYQVFSRYNRNEERQNTEKKINGFVVSDSVVLYTNDAMKESLSDLLNIIVDLCREEFGRNSILIRGAIAKGEFNKIPAVELKNLQKQLIVGDAYVKAYGMEDSFKSIGVRLSDEVYQDVENALINCDIVEESVENDKYYVLRYMNIDYLLKTEGVFHKFIFAAKKSGWLPHYYNSLYIVMKGVTNTRKVDKLFDVILTEVSGGSPSENWRDVDKFIKKSFNSGVFSTYQTRFLTYLRNHLQISNEHD
jgi:hypothetical protein